MDQVVNEQQATGQPNKQRITRILIVLIIIILIFAIPYSLNLLSQKSPKQNNKPTASTPIASSSAKVFQYDAQKAETLLTQYIKDTIKPEFLPAEIKVKQGSPINGKFDKGIERFGAFFETKESTIAVNFHFKENTAISNNFRISIQPANVTQTTATATLANSLLAAYFTNPYSVSNCQTKGNSSSCENFQTAPEGKKGYGIAFVNNTTSNNQTKLIPIIFTCFMPKESEFFDKTLSCM